MVFVTTALIVVGGALVTTPQATIMMSSAPADLGGAVSAVKSAVNEGGYSLGPALFALVGINLFLTDSVHDLSRSGITRAETREALVTAHGGRGHISSIRSRRDWWSTRRRTTRSTRFTH